MARAHSEIHEKDILGVLQGARHPLSVRELASQLDAHGRARQALKKALRRLRQSGRIAEVRGGRFILAERKQAQEARHAAGKPHPRAEGKALGGITGRLVAHRDGYGFVIPDKPIPGIQGDVFIPPNAMSDAMHGDRVRVRLVEGQRGRRGTGRKEGRIIGVEKRAHATIVGQFRVGPNYNFVQPYDNRLRQPIVIPRGAERIDGRSTRELDGMMVNVEITRFAESTAALAQGRVLEVLGKPGDFGLDVELIIRKYHIPHQFPDEVLAEARAVPREVQAAEAARRHDFRELPIVTIDGEDAKDFDDAVYVERRPNGHWRLQVHIADVSHYVRPGSELDREARLRGTSVYFPDRAVPMLPEELSNGICSLRPEVERLVLSCVMELDARGEVTDYWFAEGVIRSAARMTYTAVNACLEGDAETRQRYAALVPEFEKMKELALILNAKRDRRGSIDFDLPEPIIRFDERGQMVGIARSERNIAHRLIEEFMLAANETVAGFLERQGVASLYRIHETPDPQKVMEFEEIAATFGYSLGLSEQMTRKVRIRGREHGHGRRQERAQFVPERIAISPRHYQSLVAKIEGKPEERILSYLMLRSLKQARYSEKNVGHFALATPCYTHFTSPIRRYPDLIVHRLLRWALAADAKPARAGRELIHASRIPAPAKRDGEHLRGPLTMEELASIASESSDSERRADDAERELIDLKKLDYMEQHLGDEFDGLIISVAKFGFWVELLELFVEGFVPLESLDPAADYFFREPTRSIAPGRRSKVKDAPTFRLGDRIRVRVDRIDRVLKQIQFSVTRQGKTGKIS
ncbi:MAG TPA: VacB/RNase II family 3'-5' exoribonuclease [Candidatus Xenobia bacterium]|nr:VacB/RNase II family 3'-5' exoribonuclease [Candidatus Xenobia bacterium]